MTFKGLIDFNKEKRDEFMHYVSDEILKLYTSGKPITHKTYESMRMNSYERRLLHPLLDDDTLIKVTEYSLSQIRTPKAWRFKIPRHYEDAILSLHIYELIKRLKDKL